jgi:hypothetical protein
MESDVKLRQLITEVLATGRGDPIAAALFAWERLWTATTVIGKADFCALFQRALSQSACDRYVPLTTREFDTLAALLGAMTACLQSQRQADVEHVSTDVLDSFAHLLAGLIGDAMTFDILYNAWVDTPHESHHADHS